nr:hypothetical protein [Porphyrostromium boryanum]
MCIKILTKWFSNHSVSLSKNDLDIRTAKDGFNFLNYQILPDRKCHKKRSFHIVPSKQAIQLFNQNNREIIQALKSGPIKLLIKSLKSRVLYWGRHYVNYSSRATFIYIDKVLFSQIRAAILRRHPGKSKYWINNKYFPSNKIYYFEGKEYHTSWVLTDTSSLVGNFLPRIQWVRRMHYVKVVETKSLYDKDMSYWSKR